MSKVYSRRDFLRFAAFGAAGAALAGLSICRDEPERRLKLGANLSRLRRGLASIGLEIPESPAAIIPVIIGDPARTMQVCQRLLGAGIYVQGIRPPTVPEGTSRLRITLSAAHSQEQVERLVREMDSVSGLIAS